MNILYNKVFIKGDVVPICVINRIELKIEAEKI